MRKSTVIFWLLLVACSLPELNAIALANVDPYYVTWRRTSSCELDSDEDRIIMYRNYEDGTQQQRILRRKCDDHYWEDTGWGERATLTPLSNPLGTTVDPNGNLLLLGAAPGTGGMFTGGPPTARVFAPDMTTTITLVAAIVNYQEPSLQ